jgi:hypothetical protein
MQQIKLNFYIVGDSISFVNAVRNERVKVAFVLVAGKAYN